MKETARKIFGDEIADQVKDVWGFDEEGELRTMWRRTGHSGTYRSEQILPAWQSIRVACHFLRAESPFTLQKYLITQVKYRVSAAKGPFCSRILSCSLVFGSKREMLTPKSV